MAIHSISLDTSTTIVADTSGDVWLVKTGVEVTTAGAAINGTGSNGNKTFLIHGHLIAEGDGIDLGDSVLNNGGGNRVHILPTGSIFAENRAIESAGGFLNLTNEGSLFSNGTAAWTEDGNNTITNTGTITSYNGHGIYANGGNNIITNTGTITATFGSGILATGDNNTISNGGDITVQSMGIYATGNGNLVVNSGSVVSSSTSTLSAAVNIAGLAGESNRLVNNGELSSRVNAVLGYDGNETVVNRGAMNGNVVLGLGNDFVRNAGQVFGDVDLGAGNDRFKGWGGEVEGNIHGRGGNDTLIGGAADDAIFGDWGNDLLKGGNGDDILIGGAGRDVMRGGLGSDTFDFNNTNESAVGPQRDSITDFSKVEDFIDVSTIDAKTGNIGNQFFTFIGAQGFHGVKGELHARTSGANTIVEGDTNGDSVADFSILVVGVTGLTADDFIL